MKVCIIVIYILSLYEFELNIISIDMTKHVLNCHSLKIMIILSLFSIIIINNYFSAKLTAKMNVKSKVDKINSLDDLFDSNLNLIVHALFINKMKAMNNNYFINKFKIA